MLNKSQKKKLIEIFDEDISGLDVSSSLITSAKASALLKTNEDCILAGLEECAYIAKAKGLKFKSGFSDGKKAFRGQVVAELEGNNKRILEVERTLLNILGRMSGIATICRKAKDIAGEEVEIYLTRKTMPGFNEFDKKASFSGGAKPHRKNLNEMILLKPNHLIFFSSLEDAVEKAKKQRMKTKARTFEVEAQSAEQAIELAKLGVPWIMIDNFTPEQADKTMKEIRKIAPKAVIECSGGINLSNLKEYSKCRPNIISMGLLTKDAGIIDFSLKVMKNG